MSTSPLPSIRSEDHVFSVSFHPQEQIVAFSTVSGGIRYYSFDLESQTVECQEEKYKPHKGSCRVIGFEPGSGSWLASAGSDGRLIVSDMHPRRTWYSEKSVSGVSSLMTSSESPSMLVTGEDEGAVCIYDIRSKSGSGPSLRFDEQSDYISSLSYLPGEKSLLATSGDATLACFDLRKNKSGLTALSDPQEDELLSVGVMGSRTITGDSAGILGVWKSGFWGDIKDRVVDLKGVTSIDCMNILRKDQLLLAGGDGLIRIVELFPHSILGVVGIHENNAQIESVAVDEDLEICASAGHDGLVRFWTLPSSKQLKKSEIETSSKKRKALDGKAVEKQRFFSDL